MQRYYKFVFEINLIVSFDTSSDVCNKASQHKLYYLLIN